MKPKNYCDKIDYTLYTATGSFEKAVDELLRQLPEERSLLRLVFFGWVTDNEEYVASRSLLKRKLEQHCDSGELPAWSYVAEPSLGDELTLEVHSYRPTETDTVHYRHSNGLPYVVVENGDGRFLFCGGFQGDVQLGIHLQAIEVFRLAMEVLNKEGFEIENIIRQWNYIEKITAFNGVDQHYQMFNNVRSNFYKHARWHTGYPAATGIGSDFGGVLVDIDAARFHRPECFTTPIDNKLQVAAHAYSEEVLKVAQQEKSTPKFERARSMTFDNRRLIYISGTAAIRGEASLKGVGVERQFHITMENIAQLTGKAKLRMLRVYLKHPSDYARVRKWLEECQPDVPASYLCADVCREELLIEIEGIAYE